MSPAQHPATSRNLPSKTRASFNLTILCLYAPIAIREPILANPFRTMISRSAIGRNAQLALRRQCCAKPTGRRGMAAAASESTSTRYENEDVAGIKVASRDVAGPTTKLAVVVKAGSRYEPLPGLAFGLERYAFKVCGPSDARGRGRGCAILVAWADRFAHL